MSQFNYYPVVMYPGPENDHKEYQMNITRRIDSLPEYKSNERYYFNHDIEEAETPEIIADKLYDNVEWSWIILQFNNIINPFEEWCKSTSELHSFILEKYKDPYEINQWISIETGYKVDPLLYPKDKVRPITNYEYEQIINNRKRSIKVPYEDVARSIAQQHKVAFSTLT